VRECKLKINNTLSTQHAVIDVVVYSQLLTPYALAASADIYIYIWALADYVDDVCGLFVFFMMFDFI